MRLPRPMSAAMPRGARLRERGQQQLRGQFLHVYIAVDECGNESAPYDQVVTLIDETAPEVTIACPADADLFADADCAADTTPAAVGTATSSATDNCDDDLDNELSHSDAIEAVCDGSYIIDADVDHRVRWTTAD